MKKRMLKLTLLGVFAILISSLAVAGIHKRKEKTEVPEAVKSQLAENYPNAAIKDIEKDEEKVLVYEVELALEDGTEVDVTLLPDGTIIEIENDLKTTSLPFDLSKILPKDAKIKKVEREILYAKLVPVTLENPQENYIVELALDGREVEYLLDTQGNIVKQTVEDEDDDDNDKDGDHKGKHEDNDDDEKTVSINNVPEAVKAVILTEAQGSSIGEIEVENENGQVIYEAEILNVDQKTELLISSEGKLLSKKTENDDEDDDQDED